MRCTSEPMTDAGRTRYREIKKVGENMSRTFITFDELEAKLFANRMEEMFQQAYEKGVQDGMQKYAYPPVLKNEHLAEIFQVKPSTVSKIITNPSFPRLSAIQARYPRDEVFAWIERNTTFLKEVI